MSLCLESNKNDTSLGAWNSPADQNADLVEETVRLLTTAERERRRVPACGDSIGPRIRIHSATESEPPLAYLWTAIRSVAETVQRGEESRKHSARLRDNDYGSAHGPIAPQIDAAGPGPVSEEDWVDWDVHLAAPPPRPTRTIMVRLEYVGRGVPLPADDPSDE